MYVSKLKITNYRNYTSDEITLSPGVNIFVGKNAQGKTNLLEAIYLASVGRSARTPRDKELVKWGENKAYVYAEAVKAYGGDIVEIVIDGRENKRIAINSMPISRIGELMGVIKTVLFSPDELKIVKESPSERRRFMDIALCQMSRSYFYLLNRYNKILTQRNKLLKGGQASEDVLSVWDAQLTEVGAKIIKTRRGFLMRLGNCARVAHSDLTDGAENLTVEYEGLGGETAEDIKNAFLCELKLYRDKDLYHGYTHVGPQKDDMKIEADGVDLRGFGSQGQQRTAALSLKLGELELFKNETGEYPVFLLDDVLSELDKSRQIQLLKKVTGYQTVITCTHLEQDLRDAVGKYQEFSVNNGKIIKID